MNNFIQGNMYKLEILKRDRGGHLFFNIPGHHRIDYPSEVYENLWLRYNELTAHYKVG